MIDIDTYGSFNNENDFNKFISKFSPNNIGYNAIKYIKDNYIKHIIIESPIIISINNTTIRCASYVINTEEDFKTIFNDSNLYLIYSIKDNTIRYVEIENIENNTELLYIYNEVNKGYFRKSKISKLLNLKDP